MPPIFLNHFFVTLDRATFAAVRASEWLRSEFAPFEERTTRRNDTTYTGAYFYGRNTYFEFFEEGSEPGRVKGASGVAFGVEVQGGNRQLSGVLPEQVEITRQVDGAEPIWFHSAGFPGVQRADFFRTWVMEYHAAFLRQWHPTLPPPATASSLRRRNVLDRYVAKIGEAPRRASFLLKDVTALDLSLDPDWHKRFLDLTAAFGYQSTTNGAVTTATGPEIRIAVRGGSAGIRSAEFSLQQPPGSEIRQRFGSSELVVSPRGYAVWRF